MRIAAAINLMMTADQKWRRKKKARLSASWQEF